MTLDGKLKDLLDELSRCLSDAISTSIEVAEAIQEIRGEGYAVHLLIDCKPEDEPRGEQLVRLEQTEPTQPAGPSATFRINATDLQFLKSVGIDPTRRSRGRKRLPGASESL